MTTTHDAAALRRAFVNASRREALELTVPPGVDLALPLVGWRDRKVPLRGWLLRTVGDDAPVGLVLRSTEQPMSRRLNAMCDLCRTPRPGDEVRLFVARRSRKDGDSVGHYVCTDFDCTTNALEARDPDAALQGLLARFDLFVAAASRS
jgi:hypothetical protein